MTVSRISRHGNGYAVHLPRKLLALLGWNPGDHLQLTEHDCMLIAFKLAPVPRPPFPDPRKAAHDAQTTETV